MDRHVFEANLQAAFDLHTDAITISRSKDFESAFAKWNEAILAYDAIASQNTLALTQHISLQLSRALTLMARGVAERHFGDQTAATTSINDANEIMDSLRAKIVAESGTVDWNATNHGVNWHFVKGRILTNIGALEFESGNHEQALSIWLVAEQHLFDKCVLPSRDNAKPKHVARTLALWRCILRAALATGNKQQASDVTCNAVRLFATFCGDAGEPIEVRNAFLDLLLEIERLEPQQRKQLDSELPPQVVGLLSELLRNSGKQQSEERGVLKTADSSGLSNLRVRSSYPLCCAVCRFY